MRSPPRPCQLATTANHFRRIWTLILAIYGLIATSQCMTDDEIRSLREETVDIFYHGYQSYFKYGFPDDELKPVTCKPLFRDRENPAHIEVNDVLGNYSLTLIDSLSTLAILASSPSKTPSGKTALQDFQHGVATVVKLYGDGSDGPAGEGTRSRGFDQDSKVQVFETVIRGVGGLLSGHLFAAGDLPITGYKPTEYKRVNWMGWKQQETRQMNIKWPNGFVYNGQLLRLAVDLASRLLPAFTSDTGLPYPRVNLRYGIPFYPNSPLNSDPEYGLCEKDGNTGDQEITETCSAGAGSLVLEFATLSRLTGDNKFEQAAKRAFHAVWERRSNIDLIGAGIDAETGDWVSPFTGIGAGIDSYFEYALKSHILLSGLSSNEADNQTTSYPDFLQVWQDSHAAIKRHLYRGSDYHHPHYLQGDIHTGATRAYWIDSLSAYYPGLLTLGGELDEAIETHMLHAALWTRYAAFPERWSTATGNIESELKWWGGRPEFIESTWYLYRATKDPWYLHVGEMILRDIKRRCWTKCGWAGLEDVRSGELKDRMESFFLGETAKYLYLLFEPAHPLNVLDAPYVFTTEGHPLLIPPSHRKHPSETRSKRSTESGVKHDNRLTCPTPSPLLPLTVSPMASRGDYFHAASLARLHHVFIPQDSEVRPLESGYDEHNMTWLSYLSPNNYTYYPWTLPLGYIPSNGQSSELKVSVTFDLSFPHLSNNPIGLSSIKRVQHGVQIGSLSGVKLGLVREVDVMVTGTADEDVYRIYSVSNTLLGRDEKVLMAPNVVADLNPADPYFTRHREITTLDIMVDAVTRSPYPDQPAPYDESQAGLDELVTALDEHYSGESELLDELPLNITLRNIGQDNIGDSSFFQTLVDQLSSILGSGIPSDTALKLRSLSDSFKSKRNTDASLTRYSLAANTATGVGAAPLPDVADSSGFTSGTNDAASQLTWKSIYIADDGCQDELPLEVVSSHQILVLKRGGCSFVDKLKNIPSVPLTSTSLQLVIVVSNDQDPQSDDEARLQMEPMIHPLLDSPQYTPSGLPRYNPLSLVLVGGGESTMDLFRRSRGVGLRRRYHFSSQGVKISNLYIV